MSATAVLVVAAHPDDEVLGCGATIARLTDSGHQVHVLILAEGETSRSSVRDPTASAQELSELRRCARAANAILGSTSLKLCDFPDNRLDSVDLLEVIKVIEAEVKHHGPRMVFTHHSGDVNVDHNLVHDAVLAACRPQPGTSVKELFFFEVPSSTEWRTAEPGRAFLPNCFFDAGPQLGRKIEAMKSYKTEIREFPHPRSVEALESLARWRGATVGCRAAEAFMVGRSVR